MARRHKHQEAAGNTERWVVSYADFITLLLAFFVVMYSISSVNEGKYRVLSESLAGIFRGPDMSFDPVQVGDLQLRDTSRDIGLMDQASAQQSAGIEGGGNPETEQLQQIQSAATAKFQELINDGEISISANKLWVEIEIGSGVLFASGSATPALSADAILEALASLLSPYENPLHVEGYTDNQPISSDQFPSNWELSAARAAGVVRMLAHFGIAPERMAAVGYGQYQPKVSNLSANGRRKNRRVVIIVSRDERVQRALSGYGSGYISEDAVDNLLQQPRPQSAEAPAEGGIQRVETEQGGVLFTQGETPEQTQQ
ncbi:flagellar motor protein MotD [Motiliproteus coralliicola]|uniref:Flagellar motor protein MotD n=1 Tax=Motiliproteus coralliicola TaxID=2283196 RepID=A0A369WP98_9GAMM|nr:flagellar motor protein MotD [Motiliproteus coralliicola]RDE22434.1 flagellar motor protein MotD [Motiliproteus coralliicola]